ncbi:hypothetical protein N4P33_07430 [Streptomyces sp. 15-116A]|uniref:hypothetical protein n=1 Tax=Streptomyces sp. 15-116A TaxID=2259035 RepID=UPI0021B17A70|nr:hypothetical protein [Streptomyces sp. 15-116A]MCT7352006.1 hypothetical protein [Streptomyces sp. 15-116A]
MATAVAAATLALALPGIAQGSEPAPQVQELIGKGSDACPDRSLCLYEHNDLNNNETARIWVFPLTQARTDYSLRGHAAANQPTSAYLKAPGTGSDTAYLFPDYQCGFEGDREAEAISFRRNEAYNVLRGHNGRAKRYGYFYKNGRWTKDKKWGITEQTLNLNDRAGCVSVGSFTNTYSLRPEIDGDM